MAEPIWNDAPHLILDFRGLERGSEEFKALVAKHGAAVAAGIPSLLLLPGSRTDLEGFPQRIFKEENDE